MILGARRPWRRPRAGAVLRSAGMSTIVVERDVICASPPGELWATITDTERLNRAIGLGKIDLTKAADGTAARYVVSTVSGGFPLEYEERPYEWVENRRFSVQRIVRKGLAESIVNSFTVALVEDGSSRLRIRIEIEPKLGFLAPIMRVQVRRFIDRIAGEFEQIDKALAAGKTGAFAFSKPRLDWTAFERAARALVERVPETQKELVTRLIDFVSAAPDFDVDRIRPFELADHWGAGRREMLGLCLHATVAGLLELNWDIVCPSCRTSSARLKSLESVGEHGGCHLCDITYDLDLDSAIEATFRPAKGLRDVDEGPYCIGGPARTPHVYAQVILPPRGQATIPAPDVPGRYRLFVRGGGKTLVDVVDDAPDEVHVVASEETTPSSVALKPGGRVVVEHPMDVERHAKLERTAWQTQAATAHELSTLPEFRRMFAKEILRPGLTLSVAKVALVFTDLTGSTAMYSELGDAKAFRIVQDHFVVLSELIESLGGVVVKTIGDAVMVAFTDDAHAVRCAVGMHRVFRVWREGARDAKDLRLKIGVHAGPCYAVTANGALDYFGQTVNVAARLQGQADPGEVVMTEQLALDATEGGWLEGYAITAREDAVLKGVDEGFRIARVACDPESGQAPSERRAKTA